MLTYIPLESRPKTAGMHINSPWAVMQIFKNWGIKGEILKILIETI